MDDNAHIEGFREKVSVARAAMARGEWPTAVDRWMEAMSLRPDLPAAYAGAGSALGMAGRAEESEKLLSDAVTRFPEHEPVAVAWAQAAQRAQNWAVALDRWHSVERQFSRTVVTCNGRLAVLRGAGEIPTPELLKSAEETLLEARGRGEDTLAARRLDLEIARARGERSAVRGAVESLLESLQDANQLVGLARACLEVGELATAEQAASLAVKAGPENVAALNLLGQLTAERGDGETAVALYRKLVELKPDTVAWRKRYGELLVWIGAIAEAAEALEILHRHWREHPYLRRLLRVHFADIFPIAFEEALQSGPGGVGDSEAERQLVDIHRKAPADHRLLRPPLSQEPQRDMLVARTPGAETLVLVFAASNDSISIPLRTFDRYMASLPVDVVYLKDFNRLRFLQGVRSLAGDYEDTLEALGAVLAGIGAKRVVTIGHCVGGYAAMCYGVDLRAQRAITFDAPTDAGSNGQTELYPAYSFHRRRLIANVQPAMYDLKQFLANRRCGTDIQMHYQSAGEYRPGDILGLSSLPGVTMVAHPHVDGDNLLRQIAHSSEDFGATLADLIGVERSQPSAPSCPEIGR
jgi:tetratricopeptide (TPR) repeat protein